MPPFGATGQLADGQLVSGALLTTAAMTAAGAVSVLVMPGVIASSAEGFGTIGAAFALIAWLTALGFRLDAQRRGGYRRVGVPAPGSGERGDVRELGSSLQAVGSVFVGE